MRGAVVGGSFAFGLSAAAAAAPAVERGKRFLRPGRPNLGFLMRAAVAALMAFVSGEDCLRARWKMLGFGEDCLVISFMEPLRILGGSC